MMKMNDINKMTPEQMEERIIELKKELLNLRFQLATGNLEKTADIKNAKKEVARIKTALNQK